MNKNSKTQQVYEHWESASRELNKDGRKATAPDQLLQKMIEDVILANISEGQRMLDVGCGDGASTKLFSGKAEEVVGIDYMPGLLEIAEKQNLLANISYHQGNVLDLSDIRQKFGVFDVVSSIRCLINLSTWEEQAQGLKEIARMVKPHGLYAASEGWSDGRAGLNARRAQCGLHEMQIGRASCRERVFRAG